ncbi:TetR-like C-terminal domain-containing protein [Microbacterium awajiense]|uniref:TetR-like C-terminal domain-containing protein n=1 Tax=Microbacterium awajiense TaxID=415214 RepID=A0ABP7AZ49_9MICO
MPRAGLTPAVVIETAARIADRDGWDQLTLAAVAEQLGVRVPSLYKHVESLDALRRGISVVSAGDLADALAEATVGVAGDEAVTRLCGAYRAYALAHPGRYAATQHPGSDNPGAARTLAVVDAVLAGYGLTGDEAVDAARALRSALHGFTTLESSGGFGIPRSIDRSFAGLVDGLVVMLSGWPRGR